MNERIQELVKQIYGTQATEQEIKFAELIVRECAKIADIADESKCEWIGGNILIHFGVEEKELNDALD